jgi:hypothetical protein
MTRKKLLVSTIAVLSVAATSLIVFSVPAFGATISEIITGTAGDDVVTVSGNITSVDGNEFVLSDGIASITVEAGPPWYQAIDLQVGDNVTVNGEVETGKDGTKPAALEAFSITMLDGTVIEIRDGPGKPPWAGGPRGSGPSEDEDDQDDDGSAVTDQPGNGAGAGASVERPDNRAGGRK